ncbi:MAG: adenylate/guanylate cyclase domain-containing protein [Synechococcaceae cyanobacterium]|nr:adenylate/guanylate cyclase domain-containing protein [Synechococcaceae cyanobacterium]
MRATRILQRIGPSLGALALLAGVEWSGLAQRFDLWFYDLITTLRPAPSARHLPITLIGIEEADIRRHGWPIDDGLLCQALDRLLEKGPAAIGLDLYRDAGVGASRDCLRQRFSTDPRLVSIFNVASGIAAVPGTPARRQGYNDLSLDADGTLRRDLVHVQGQDEATVALPLRLLEVATGDRSLTRRLEQGRLPDAWLSSDAGGYHREQDAGLGMQRMLLFRQSGSFRSYSLDAVLRGRVPASALTRRIVLIGSTAPSLKDVFLVPMTHFRGGTEVPALSGVEIHGLRLATLLEHQQGQTPSGWLMPGWGNGLLVLLCGVGGLLLGEGFRSLRLSQLTTAGALLVLGGSLTGLLYGHIWIGTSMPVLAMASLAGAAWMRRGAASQLHARQVQSLLGQATSPAVAALLWEQRDELLKGGRFEGRLLPVTVLFSDTANFTTVSEGMSPATLMAWLNRCMALCIPAVTSRGGMVNKFTGDGLMAVFGAPVSVDPAADARAATEAALDIRRGLESLNISLESEGLPPVRMRIGIHSGRVLAGSMGSSERLEYAVIGDTVNCASRLESLDKHRHAGVARILVSANTRELLPEELDQQLEWLEWGPLHVKGRNAPLQVFEIQEGQLTGS